MGKHDHELKADVYDQFADYVREKVRGRDNPNITVQDFSLMDPSGVTHMSLVLENVDKGKRRLYEQVEAFAPGTELTTRESISTGAPIYVANVPFKQTAKKGRHHHSSDNGEEAPKNWVLFGYIFMLMLLFIVAILKTEWSQWQFVFGK